MKKFLLGSVALAALGVAGGANAADMPVKAPLVAPPTCAVNDIVRANNQIAVDAVQHWSDYLEFNPANGSAFDTEKGSGVPGVGVHGSAMGDWGGICHLYVYGEVYWVKGHTAYWASGGPVTTNVDGDEVWHGDLRIGKGFDWGNNAMLTPYFGAGAHEWNRDLSGPFGYHEDYKHEYVGAGLLFQYTFYPRVVFSWWGLVGTTVDPNMTTSRNGGAAINPFTYQLGTSPIEMVGGSLDWAFADHFHVSASVEGTHYKYIQSPPAPDGSLEPTSRTYSATIKLGLGYSWWDGPVVARY
jgi:opacity protein-like surface antigen